MSYLIKPSELAIPLVVAPMFLVSSPQLVIEACLGGTIAAYPLSNSRNIQDAEHNLQRIHNSLEHGLKQGKAVGAWGINMIVHSSYQRFNDECDLIKVYKPPIVISALGSPRRIVDLVHTYGGQVWADVSSIAFAKKAIDSGVDGLILLCAGAGGHTGHLSPFAFLPAIRQLFSKIIILAGGIMDGTSIYSAQVLGADLVYMGTRFIATQESMASPTYKDLLINSEADDIISTKAVTGVNANFILASLKKNNIDPNHSIEPKLDFNKRYQNNVSKTSSPWKDIYSAGHGVGAVKNILSVKDCLSTLKKEYLLAKQQ